MNNQQQDNARAVLKRGLSKLPESSQLLFNGMYAGSSHNLGIDINKVVDEMKAEDLDWAMEQVQNSLDKISKKEAKK